MELLIQFPTRGRPERFKQYLLRYIDYREEGCQIHVSCDRDDRTMYNTQIMDFIRAFRNVSITFRNNKNKIEAVNADIPGGWDILLLASDDMWPEIKGYDRIIKDEMNAHFPDTDGVLHFNDGFQGEKLNTLSIIGRKYYDRFGYVYNPQYESLYADNEFDDVSRQLGKRKYSDQVIIRHLRKEVKRDRLHKINHTFAKQDKLRYEAFQKNNDV